jgi:cell division septum initiation protein DivIVA
MRRGMAAQTPSGAAERASREVESILAAAEAAAEQLKADAREDAKEMLAESRRRAEQALEEARTQAIEIDRTARREAKQQLDGAEKDSAQIREQTRRAIEGRVAEAEQAAAQVLEEAQTLSSGLRRLGESLGDQGERILREVQAAHKQMQADLRVAPEEPRRASRLGPSGRPLEPRRARPRGTGRAEELAATVREAEAGRGAAPPAGERSRGNPFEDLDVPDWVGRSR